MSSVFGNGYMELLAQIISTVILGLLAALLTGVGVWLRKHVSNTNLRAAMAIAASAVSAAEQHYMGAEGAATLKLKMAQRKVEELADKQGLHFSDAQWDTFIHEAVLDINQAWESLAGPVQEQHVTVEPPANGDGTTINVAQDALPAIPRPLEELRTPEELRASINKIVTQRAATLAGEGVSTPPAPPTTAGSVVVAAKPRPSRAKAKTEKPYSARG